MKNLRRTSKEWNGILSHPDFDIVEAGEENVLVVGFGGRAGRVFTNREDYSSMKEGGAGVYILASDEVRKKIEDMEPELLEVANRFARMKHCYQSDVIGVYDKKYGRPDILLEAKDA